MNPKYTRTLLALLALAPAVPGQISELPFLESFEASPGLFTTAGSNSSWQWGEPDDNFIQGAAHGLRAWVTNLDGTYNQNEASYLQSPTFDFTALTADPVLQFSHIFEHDISDESWVEVSLDGGPYFKLGMGGDSGSLNWYNDSLNDWWDLTSGPAGEWRTARHVITGGAAKMVTLRWRLQADTFVGEDGIGVDDVIVYSGNLNDAGVRSLDMPLQGGVPGSQQVISVTLENFGSALQTSFPVSYSVTGPVSSSATEMFSGLLVADATAAFTFATTADFSVPGDYVVTVTTALPGDEYPFNDELATDVSQQGTITTLPYFEGFEAGPGGYVGVGTSSTWEHGTPAANFITGAASGARAWTTNLTGDYSVFEDSSLQSPVFDLTALTNDPFLQFQHIYQIDFSDESWVEVSLDGGPFFKLGSSGDPGSLNWYNDTFGNWWDGNSGSTGQWRTARHLLTGAAGGTVQIRWRLVGGSFVNEDGVGVDNVEIFEAPFGTGQPPQPGLATLDVNAAQDVLGFPVSAVVPGPYFAVVTSSESLALHFEGSPNQPIILAAGSLQVGAVSLPPVGQLDLASDFVVLASGVDPGSGLGSLFFTNFSGVMEFSATVPLGLIGETVAFQAAILSPTTGFSLTNAVLTTFAP